MGCFSVGCRCGCYKIRPIRASIFIAFLTFSKTQDMKAFKNYFLFLPGLLLSFASPAFTQQYTIRDQKEIAHQAQLTLNMYKDLLNVIAYEDLATSSEVKELIRNSYTPPSRSQLFYSEDAIIEDNLRPSDHKSGKVQDKTVKEYLQYFDLTYEKSDMGTVDFFDFEVSHLKYSSYPYLKVKYTCLFRGKHKIDSSSYKAVDRVAEFRAEKRDNKWRTFITSVVFYDPENPVQSRKGDVELEMEVAKSPDLSVSSREMGFEQLKRRAEKAFNSRDYAGAKNKYAEALQLRPEEDEIKAEIEKLESIIRNLAFLKSKYAVGAYREAIEEYGKVIKNDRSNPDYYFGRAKNYEKLNLVREALKDYTSAIELDGNFVEALSSRASLYAETGQYHKAVADYALILSNPTYAAAYYPERARLKVRMGDGKGAIEDYNAAIQLTPDVADLYLQKGMILFDQKQTGAAVNAFSQAIEKDPQNASSFFRRGLVYAALGKLHEASSDFEKARKLGLKGSELGQINKLTFQYYKKAEGAMTEKSYQQALKSFQDALLISPAFGRAWLRKGDVHFILQEYDSAIFNYDKAITYDPFSTGYFKIGLAYLKKGDHSSATENFKRYIPVGKELLARNRKDSSGDQSTASLLENFVEERADVFYSLGYAQLMTKQFLEALENMDMAIHFRKFFPRAYFARGSALYALEDFGGAVRNMEESIRMGLSEPQVIFSLAKAYIANDQMKEAVFSLTHALELDPAFKAAYTLRAHCYKSYSQYALALKDINTALSLNKEQAEDGALIAQKGLLELYLNRPQEAKQSFDHALRLDGNNGWALYGKACALAKEQRTTESLELYRKAFQTREIEWSVIENDPLIQAASNQEAFKELVKTYL